MADAADEDLFQPPSRASTIAAPDPRGRGPLPIFKQVSPPASLSSPATTNANDDRLDMLRDVELDVRIELGRTRLRLQDVLNLSEGAVVEMDRLAGEPVEVFVSDRLVARGEVMVHGERLCVRVSEILNHGEKR
jgi:flagellar motor switch protein FliN/FliY